MACARKPLRHGYLCVCAYSLYFGQKFDMDFSLEKAMQIAIDAAHSAGEILCEMLETAAVREKGPKDLVTDADIAAQQCIENRIMAASLLITFWAKSRRYQPSIEQRFRRRIGSGSSIRWMVLSTTFIACRILQSLSH